MSALLAVSALGAPACGTYNYNRAALVPHAAPRLHSGAPLDGVAEVSLGASSIAHLTKPGVGDPSAGVEIPGTQLHGDARLRLGHAPVAIGLVYENGLDAGAEPLKSTQPPVDHGNVSGYGVSLDAAIPTSIPALTIGLGLEVVHWRVPYVEYYTCQETEACFPYALQDEGVDSVETGAVSVTPTYRTGDVTVYGGITARQHPTLQQKGVDTDPLFHIPEVESGPMNVIVSAGAEVALAGGAVKLSAVGYYDVTADPAKYGPGLAALVSFPLGRRHAPPPAAAVPAAPAPYPGAPGGPPPAPYAPPPAPAPYAPPPAPAPYPPPPAAPAPPPPGP